MIMFRFRRVVALYLLPLALLCAVAGDAISQSSEPASSADSFIDSVGVNIHLGFTTSVYYTKFPVILNALKGLGIRHVRDGMPDWGTGNATYYKNQNALGDAGMKCVYIAGINDTTAYVTSYSNRVNNMEAIEAPNEYDASGDKNWASRLRQSLTNLRAAAAVIGVAAIGPSLVDANWWTATNSYATLGNVSALIDYNNLHNYPAGNNSETPGWGGCNTEGHCYGSLAWTLDQTQFTGSFSLPTWTTETGYYQNATKNNSAPAEVIATYLPRLLLWQYNGGVRRTYIYELADDPTSLQYGLLDNTGAPRPAYTAVASLMNLLADPGPAFTPTPLAYSIQGSTANVARTLLAKRDGTYWLMLWVTKSIYDPNQKIAIAVPQQNVTVRLPANTRAVMQYKYGSDWQLHSTGLAVNDASVTLAVGSTVTALQITLDGDRMITQAADPVSVRLNQVSTTLTAGRTSQLFASVSGTMNTSVTWSLSPSVGSISASGLYTAPSAITATQAVTVTATSVADPGQSASATITLTPTVTVALTPVSAAPPAGQSTQFAAQVAGTTDMNVTWTMSPAIGSLSGGLYTAPSTITADRSVLITATSQADPTKSATSTVTLRSAISGPTVSVNFQDQASRPAMVVGFLMGLQSQPAVKAVLETMRPGIWRIGSSPAMFFPGDTSRWWPIYEQLTAAGVRPQLVLSDGWGYPSAGVRPPYENWSAWESYVRRVAGENKGKVAQYDIWNEPDLAWNWKGTEEQMFETYVRAYRVLQQELGPDPMVGGLSLSRYDEAFLTRFLTYCVQNSVKVAFVSWHENQNTTDGILAISSHVMSARTALQMNPAYASLSIQQLQINEMIGPALNLSPAGIVAHIYQAERGKADAAIKACWGSKDGSLDCFNSTVDGVNGAGQNRASGWAYQMYADGSSSRATSTSSDKHLSIIATPVRADGSSAQVLIAYCNPEATTSVTPSLYLDTLTSLSFLSSASRVHLTVERVSDTGETAIVQPDRVLDIVLPITAGTASTTLPSMKPGDLYRAIITGAE